MKGTDAKKIDDVLTEAIDLVNKMGVAALPGYIDGKLAELEEVRKRPDRRTLRSTFVGVSVRRSGAAADSSAASVTPWDGSPTT